MINGVKIVTAHEMSRIEGEAFARGESAEKFMDQAGSAIANIVQNYIEEKKLPKKVFLLAGKGNNAGDAYATGLVLLQKGFSVSALHLYSFEHCGPLCRAKAENFRSAGGAIRLVRQEETIDFPESGIILDGLVGTGFKDKPDEVMAMVITKANQSSLPIIAIDIPSGVSGNTGEVATVAISAMMTTYLGLPKLGFFLRDGYNHIGELQKVDFGLKNSEIDQAKEEGFLYDTSRWRQLLPKVLRNQHKYQRGYVLVWAGSSMMPGAAIFSCMGALRGGAGIVRLFHDETKGPECGFGPWEIIYEPLVDLDQILEEAKRAGSLLLGPGLGRDSHDQHRGKKLIEKCCVPLVIDADGLLMLPDLEKIPSGAILTPHRGEIRHLIGDCDTEEKMLHAAQEYVEQTGSILLCKGAPTILFHRGKKPLFLSVGNPGMATAGSGDILSGIIASLRAQKLSAYDAAIVGVCLHGCAGDIAQEKIGTRSMIASDLLEALPAAYANRKRSI